jgi:hypothetical protein
VVLQSALETKERLVQELEDLVINKLPTEFKNFDFLYKKELEINNKIKQENSQKNKEKEDFTNCLKDLLKVYKEVSMIAISKTDKGYLKINFNNIAKNGKEVYIVLQVMNDYKIIELYPSNINISSLEEELMKTKNFTLFLAKLANELIKYYNK